MKLTDYFLPLLKETPSEAQIASHRLMLRAGMIKQQAAGIYTWLPLGLAVLRNIENIVNEELQKSGCVPLLMPTLQPTDLWKESGRYEAFGKEMLRFPDRAERELLYSPTCEEMIVDVFRSSLKSYKQLPKNLYQINWKFRDEVRPRFGVMRGREFFMKDGYSFHTDMKDAEREYALMYDTYHRIFSRMGLTAIAVKADSGAIGGSMSHEFQVLADTGESAVYYDSTFDEVRSGRRCLTGDEMRNLYAAADEQHKPEECPLPADQLSQARGIEVGHIFLLGQKYTEAMKVMVSGADGVSFHPFMGTYGLGVSRLVGAIIEAYHDEAGIIWPESVAPFQVGIINLRSGDHVCDAVAESVYNSLKNAGKTVLYDDTDARAGEKFASMDLIGLPWQITIGPKGAAAGSVELKYRLNKHKTECTVEEAMQRIVAQNI